MQIGESLFGVLAMPNESSVRTKAAVTLACLVLWTHATFAEGIIKSLPRPGQREFVRDLADMLSAHEEEEIKTLCDQLLTAKATPIIVVTINSMAEHGGRGMRIETFARLLFDQWEVGVDKINGQVWNTGIMLLVSKDDRKARIELGGGWKRDHDDQCARIMAELIIPEFRQGRFSDGIEAGVEGLDKMARGLKLPARPMSMRAYLIIAGVIGLAIFTAVSLYRRGSSGWAWLLWAAVFSLAGIILYHALTSRGGGGGYGGGSFSGGSSGGGGATGSW